MGRGAVILAAALLLALEADADGFGTGRSAPNCGLTSVAGTGRYELAQFHGEVLWVDFWASWCGPCAEAFSFLDGLDREFRAQGLRVLAVNLDEEVQDAKDFLARHPVGFPQAADSSGACPRDFGVPGMPASYLVDRQGVIRHVVLGFRAGEAGKLRGLVKELLAEDPGDPTAPAGGRRGEALRDEGS